MFFSNVLLRSIGFEITHVCFFECGVGLFGDVKVSSAEALPRHVQEGPASGCFGPPGMGAADVIFAPPCTCLWCPRTLTCLVYLSAFVAVRLVGLASCAWLPGCELFPARFGDWINCYNPKGGSHKEMPKSALRASLPTLIRTFQQSWRATDHRKAADCVSRLSEG